jgi:hypothetical protein
MAVVVAVIVAVLAAGLTIQILAAQQIDAESDLPPDKVFAVFRERFIGSLHTFRVEGDTLHVKPRARMYAPTLSLSARAREGGGSEIAVWMSEFTRNKIGERRHAFWVWRKRRSFLKHLDAEGTPAPPLLVAAPREPASASSPTRLVKPAAEIRAPLKPKVRGELGTGLRLGSGAAPRDCMASLEAMVFARRPPKYLHLPAYVLAGYSWHGAKEMAPDRVVCIDNFEEHPMFLTFRRDHSGIEIGVFPLGAGDERLARLPEVKAWQTFDTSLVACGTFQEGSLSVEPPPVPAQFFVNLVTTAGYPATPLNVEAVARRVNEMLLIKAWEFIKMESPEAADRFIEAHGWRGDGHVTANAILQDLAEWNPGVIPYMQGMPMRVRAILLEPGADGKLGTFWTELEDY